jgi:hypothetical protein
MLKPVLLQQHIRVVVLLLICLVGSFMANAQSYTISPGNGTCMTHVEGGTSPTYTFTAVQNDLAPGNNFPGRSEAISLSFPKPPPV